MISFIKKENDAALTSDNPLSNGREKTFKAPYEIHSKANDKFPFIFHSNYIDKDLNFQAHWHESLELLFFYEGEGIVLSNLNFTAVKTGEMAIINSGNIHNVVCDEGHCSYYCLIVDKTFTDSLNIKVDNIKFSPKAKSDSISLYMNGIISEVQNKSEFYEQSVKSYVTALLVELCRNFSNNNAAEDKGSLSQAEIVKKGIDIIQKKFAEPLTVDDICQEAGYSKFYFSRVFKQYTGKSVLQYLQQYRCEYAKSLLLKGRLNVSECAQICGIPHLSHFSKLYKRYIGNLPKDDLER